MECNCKKCLLADWTEFHSYHYSIYYFRFTVQIQVHLLISNSGCLLLVLKFGMVELESSNVIVQNCSCFDHGRLDRVPFLSLFNLLFQIHSSNSGPSSYQ